ncbi:MAG: hypothetical protein R6X02_17230 [Enhygromyxa sp.]
MTGQDHGEARLLDVTLREVGEAGGYAFNHHQAAELARQLSGTGLDMVEIGYVRPREWGGEPSARSCSPTYVELLKRCLGPVRLAVFVHLHELPRGALAELRPLGVDLIRVAMAPDRLASLRERAAELQALGVTFAVNAVRVSEYEPAQVIELGRLAEALGATVFYLADSNGSLYPAQFAALAAQLRAELSIELGAHLHDHLGLAMANALVALNHGFRWIDGSLAGEGKPGGNLATERIALHLQIAHGRRFDLAQLAHLAREWAEPRGACERAFWAAVHGALNLNQDRVAALTIKPETDRVELYAREFGFRLRLTSDCE